VFRSDGVVEIGPESRVVEVGGEALEPGGVEFEFAAFEAVPGWKC
jgi:hypothetical protein